MKSEKYCFKAVVENVFGKYIPAPVAVSDISIVIRG